MRSFFSKREHGIVNVFIYLILAMFLMGSTLLVVMGAKVYRGTNERSAKHAEARVLCAYLRSAIRGDDAAETIAVSEVDGLPVLTFTNRYGGELYVRSLYVRDGYLREAFAAAEEEGESFEDEEETGEDFDGEAAGFEDVDLGLEDEGAEPEEDEEAYEDPLGGETVCAARDISFKIEGSLLTVNVTDAAGEMHTLHMALHTAQ